MVQWWSKDTCTWYVTEVSTVRGVGERTIYGHIVAPLTGSIFPARLTIPCQALELAPPHSNDDGWACLLLVRHMSLPPGAERRSGIGHIEGLSNCIGGYKTVEGVRSN